MDILREINLFHSFLRNKGRSDGTISEYTKDLKMLNDFLQIRLGYDYTLQDVTTEDLNSYLDMLVTDRGYMETSRNRQMNTIRSFFKFCFNEEIVPKNVANRLQLLEVKKQERCFLVVDEVKKLLEAIKHPLIKIVTCTLFYTGLRINECLSLTIEDIDFDKNNLTVQKGKGNKTRVIPLHSELKPYLQNYIGNERVNHSSNKLFLTERTGQLSDVYVNRVLKETVQKLKWDKKVTCHVLRHSFASALVDCNVNIVAVKELLGHANLRTTSGYTHIHRDCVEEAIQKISL